MIEYDIDAQFITAVLAGIKSGTIRRLRIKPRRHARPDEQIEIWATVNGVRRCVATKQCHGIAGVVFAGSENRIHLGALIHNRKTWPELDLGAREGLARMLGFIDWLDARKYYRARYGEEPVTLCLVTWRDRDYSGPVPNRKQLDALRILTQHDRVIPAFGKFHPRVGHSLLVMSWAEVTDRTQEFRVKDRRGQSPIRITDLGRWILERFDK